MVTARLALDLTRSTGLQASKYCNGCKDSEADLFFFRQEGAVFGVARLARMFVLMLAKVLGIYAIKWVLPLHPC